MAITMRQARAAARALGLRIKATGWDDYRVYWPEEAKHTDRGYFTTDLEDAVDTAKAMAAERAAAAALRREYIDQGKPMLSRTERDA